MYQFLIKQSYNARIAHLHLLNDEQQLAAQLQALGIDPDIT
jgi:hypothetical protein